MERPAGRHEEGGGESGLSQAATYRAVLMLVKVDLAWSKKP